jgi:DNA-binding NarL/FixJ family response regulator
MRWRFDDDRPVAVLAKRSGFTGGKIRTVAGRHVRQVLLAGAEAALRAGLGAALAAEGILVVAEASTAADVLVSVRDLKLDLVILDVHLADASGIALCRDLRRTYRDTPVVILSGLDWDVYLAGARAAGAMGFLLHSSSLDDLTQAIQRAASGSVFTPEQQERVFTWNLHVARRLDSLQLREQDVLRQIARGLTTNEQIADVLHLSPSTVEKYVGSLHRKLGVSSRSALLAFILTHHLDVLDELT